MARPGRTLAAGLIFFCGLSFAALGYYSSGFAGALSAPKGTDVATGNALLAKHFPSASANPANLVFHYSHSVWTDATPVAKADLSLRNSGLFSQLAGPLNPNGTVILPNQLEALYAKLGPPSALPLAQPASLSSIPPAEYNAYRSLVVYVSNDGKTMQFLASLKAGTQDSTPALRATPQVRAAVDRAATVSGADASGVAGEAAAIYDVSSTSNHDLVTIIPIAILAIGLLLALVLRSLIAPLYLIVSVGLSYLAALGLSTIVFIYIGGNSGSNFRPALPHVHLPAGAGRGLQHPGHDPDTGRGQTHGAPAGSGPRRRPDRTDGHVRRHGPGRDLRRPGLLGRERPRQQPGPRDRLRPGHRHPDGHVPGEDASRPVHGGPPGPLELVALSAVH